MILSGIFGYSTIGDAQTQSIDVIRFDPPDPQPGTPLKLSIMLFPSQEKQCEISIGLITWTDKNSDCVYQADEEIRHPAIRVKDNDPDKDEEDFEDEILVQIYDVPQTQPPERYTAIVTCGNKSVSASINVPPATPCHSDIGSSGSFLETLFAKWRKFPEMFRVLKSAEATREKGYEGASNLYVYSLQENSLNRIARSEKALYLSPTWSPDSNKIACVLNQDGSKRIAWTDLTGKPIEVVTEGLDDTNPLWLPDNKHIIFLRDQHLQLVDPETHTIQAIAEEIQVDQIITVLEGQEGNVQIIYEAPKQVTYGNITLTTSKTFYLLELDQQLSLRGGSKELVSYLNWLPARFISPSGNQILYSQKIGSSTTLIIETSEKEITRLFDDEYNYYEPAWSPDGDKIVFVSDRR